MRLTGRVRKTKGKSPWIIEVPDLDIMTQGDTKDEAYEMVKDAIESLADSKEFEVYVFPGEDGQFTVSATSSTELITLLIRRQRQKREVSLGLAAKRLGTNSKNAYRQYEVTGEQGRSPSLETLEKLLEAVNPNSEVVISFVDRAKRRA